MNAFLNTLSATSDILTIAVSLIAIYVFIAKRRAIVSAFRALLNYSSQLALNDLYIKLDRLNDLTAEDPAQKAQIVNILNDILGQIRGNKALCRHCDPLMRKLTRLAEMPNQWLTEPSKRSLVSELRERLRYVAIEDIGGLLGE